MVIWRSANSSKLCWGTDPSFKTLRFLVSWHSLDESIVLQFAKWPATPYCHCTVVRLTGWHRAEWPPDHHTFAEAGPVAEGWGTAWTHPGDPAPVGLHGIKWVWDMESKCFFPSVCKMSEIKMLLDSHWSWHEQWLMADSYWLGCDGRPWLVQASKLGRKQKVKFCHDNNIQAKNLGDGKIWAKSLHNRTEWMHMGTANSINLFLINFWPSKNLDSSIIFLGFHFFIHLLPRTIEPCKCGFYTFSSTQWRGCW